MSEFMERHMAQRLIGAPPGYADSEQGGFLTEAVRRRPYSVVLFDEVEKAHPDVFHALLQVLDDGRLTDGQGRTVDFKNTVLILTSNIGSQWIAELGESQRDEMERRVQEALRQHFKPEFLNRVDEIVVYRQLGREQIGRIVEIQLDRVHQLVAERRIGLEFSEEAKRLLAEKGYDPHYGARPLKRVIQRLVQDPLAVKILEGEFPEGSKVQVDARLSGEALEFRRG
jgi:ATP-dependent Clp protease ATP-binding subunit ClpB